MVAVSHQGPQAGVAPLLIRLRRCESTHGVQNHDIGARLARHGFARDLEVTLEFESSVIQIPAIFVRSVPSVLV